MVSDGGGVGDARRTGYLQAPETAREHLRNALAILYDVRDGGTVTLGQVRALEARLRRALEQCDRGNI